MGTNMRIFAMAKYGCSKEQSLSSSPRRPSLLSLKPTVSNPSGGGIVWASFRFRPAQCIGSPPRPRTLMMPSSTATNTTSKTTVAINQRVCLDRRPVCWMTRARME
jgi:hypothetical protein